MAERTVQCWQIFKPSGTPASPAQGNTCECPSLVVSDGWYSCSWLWCCGLLNYVKISYVLFSAPVSSWRCGSWVNRSVPDLRLHTWWEWDKIAIDFIACSRLSLTSEPRPLSPAGGWYTGPTYRPQNVLLTNSLEIIEKILGMCTDACKPQATVACTVMTDHILKVCTGVFVHKCCWPFSSVPQIFWLMRAFILPTLSVIVH